VDPKLFFYLDASLHLVLGLGPDTNPDPGFGSDPEQDQDPADQVLYILQRYRTYVIILRLLVADLDPHPDPYYFVKRSKKI